VLASSSSDDDARHTKFFAVGGGGGGSRVFCASRISFFLSFSLARAHQARSKVFLLVLSFLDFSNFFSIIHLGYQTTQKSEPSLSSPPTNLHFSSRPHPRIHHEGTPLLFFDRLWARVRLDHFFAIKFASNARFSFGMDRTWFARTRAGATGMRAIFARFLGSLSSKKGRDARVLNPTQSEDAREKKREK